MDVEHTKAHEKPCDHCVLIWQGWARAVERVQALHTPHRRPGHASDGTCESCYRVYPCPTIRVLEKS